MSLEQKMCPSHRGSSGDEILSRLLQGAVGTGQLENSLLRELQEGYPITKLRLLLKANDQHVVAAGMWIASELGSAARPLLKDIADLIRHPHAQVRFFALDCLLACAGPKDGQVVSLALDLLDDSEFSVRWKTLVFLATASEILLRAALDTNALSTDEHTSTRREGLKLLLDSNASADPAAVVSLLASSDPMLRRYAAAAAARMAHRDPRALKQVMKSADPTLKQFAVDMGARAGIEESFVGGDV